jgi:hypothetical protein
MVSSGMTISGIGLPRLYFPFSMMQLRSLSSLLTSFNV